MLIYLKTLSRRRTWQVTDSGVIINSVHMSSSEGCRQECSGKKITTKSATLELST